MIPSENTANLVSALPENRSMNCRADSPRAGLAAFCRSWSFVRSTSGTGMCEPRRNTAMIPIVNRIFLRRSGILNALTNAFSTAWGASWSSREPQCTGSQDLYSASGLLDLGPGGGRDGMGTNGQGPVQLSLPEDLHRKRLPDHPSLAKELGCDLRAGLEGLAELVHVDHCELDPVGIGEPLELGDPALKGHLAALESGLGVVACVLALRPTPGRLALAGCLSPPDPTPVSNRTLGGTEMMELHVSPPLGSLRPERGGRPWRSCPGSRGGRP